MPTRYRYRIEDARFDVGAFLEWAADVADEAERAQRDGGRSRRGDTGAMRSLEILEGGIQTTVQDYPGRRGMQAQGFFPAGPMDHLAHGRRTCSSATPYLRRARDHARKLSRPPGRRGNDRGLRRRARGHRRRRRTSPSGRATTLPAGAELAIGIAPEAGLPLLPRGRRRLRRPAALRLARDLHDGRARRARGPGAAAGRPAAARRAGGDATVAGGFAPGARPEYSREWEVRAMRGPQAAPDFLTEDDMQTLFGRAVAGRPELQPHGHPARVPQVRVGAAERRHRRRPPVEHPRQQLSRRRDQRQRRPAGHPRTRRADRGRLRRRGDRDPRRLLEDRPVPPRRRHRALPRGVARGGGGGRPRLRREPDRREAWRRSDGETIKSPLPGTFYRRLEPGGGPVRPARATRSRPGDVVGLVEIMKTFHEIHSDAAGRIARFLVENEDARGRRPGHHRPRERLTGAAGAEGPRRQPGGDRAAGDPRLPRARARDGRRLLDRRRARPARSPRGRGRLHRAAARPRELPERGGDHRGRAARRRRRRPSRLRLPRRERAVRERLPRRRPCLRRTRARRRSRRWATRRGPGSSRQAQGHRRSRAPREPRRSRRLSRSPRDRLPGADQGCCRRRRPRHPGRPRRDGARRARYAGGDGGRGGVRRRRRSTSRSCSSTRAMSRCRCWATPTAT